MPEREHRLPSELDRSLAQTYASTFISRSDQYPLQLPDGRYISVKKPLNTELITRHITGKITLGAYALDVNSEAHWLCLDVDTSEQWNGLLQLAEVLQNQEITPYLEQSRRGGHLWLFTSKLAGKTIRQFGRLLLHQADLDDVELYPKQDELKTGPGSLVRLPLGIHQKSGRRYHFIQLKGKPLAPTIREQIALLTNPIRVPLSFIEQSLAETPPPPTPSPTTSLDKIPMQSGEHLSERIRGSISVYEFVNRYVALDGRGRGFCPFHEDTHKSFGVNAERNFWHCWADCGSGSVIDFWMKWRETKGKDASFVATITDLAQILF